MVVTCPHGDNSCPCPDGDPCHYEGTGASRCPNPPHSRTNRLHCHVEGCRYEFTDDDGCGLTGLLPGSVPPPLPGDVGWVCGAFRAAERICNELGID